MTNSNRPEIIIEHACVYCRQLTGHAPACVFNVNQSYDDPCTWGVHRWAWLSDGGQACGRCRV